jgi:hypothetical protein
LIPELLEANGIETEEYIEYRVTTGAEVYWFTFSCLTKEHNGNKFLLVVSHAA